MAIALIFGLGSLNYQLGQLSRAGPGLFPLMVSSIVFLIGVVSVVRSRFVKAEPVTYNFKNISVIILGLLGFALLSEHLNMIVGITFLVFCVSFAGSSYSVARNLKVSASLIGVALIFQKLLGLQLPLF
ncbi:MAG: hypothetical protein RL300_907 [Pseudomonadota bacterium]